MLATFKDFVDGLVLEELHPEIRDVLSSSSGPSKQTQLANKIKDLSARGEKTGIEGNMPEGSSRAYLKHDTSHRVMLDGRPATIPIGTKVAIRARLDKYHNKRQHDGMGLGQLQNKAEAGDHWVNNNYRVFREHPDKDGEFKTNEHGIFPPLIDHDHENHHWSKVGHAKDVTKKDFKELTKTESHPEGISHDEFTHALDRFHERQNGKYHKGNEQWEKKLDKVDEHPLVQNFQDYHGNTGHPTYDYHQIKNLGVFQHPDGPKMVVARDHGFDTEVAHAYSKARKAKNIPPVLRGI